MTFRLRVSKVVSTNSSLVVTGTLLDGVYHGPERVKLCDKSGERVSASILQHEVICPKSWPIIAGDGSALVLHIARPNSPFELDEAQIVVGEGAISPNSNRIDVTNYLSDPSFWAIHMSLHAFSDTLPDPLLAWKMCQEDETREYERLFEPHWAAGTWPFILMPVGGGRFVEIEFAAGVEHQERVWIGDSVERRVLMGYHSGHFSLPTFRVAEVLQLGKSIEAHPSAALLLLPGAYSGADQTWSQEIVTGWVKQIPGVQPEFIPQIVESLAGNDVPGLQWQLNENLGWINNWEYSQRNPSGSMSTLSADDFKFIREFFTYSGGD